MKVSDSMVLSRMMEPIGESINRPSIKLGHTRTPIGDDIVI